MEITVLRALDHPRVLHFFEAYEDFKDSFLWKNDVQFVRHPSFAEFPQPQLLLFQDIYIVTELCTGGDLQQCMAEMQGTALFFC